MDSTISESFFLFDKPLSLIQLNKMANANKTDVDVNVGILLLVIRGIIFLPDNL